MAPPVLFKNRPINPHAVDVQRSHWHLSEECKDARRQLAWRMKVVNNASTMDIVAAIQNAGLGSCTPATVRKYVHEMGQKLFEEFKDEALGYKMVVHERLEKVIEEATRAWERSQTPQETTITVEGRATIEREGGGVIEMPAQVTTQIMQSNGNPAFLQKVLDATKQQADLWGVNSPKKTDVTSGGQPIKAYVGVDVEDV